jgi:hypothetical protein
MGSTTHSWGPTLAYLLTATVRARTASAGHNIEINLHTNLRARGGHVPKNVEERGKLKGTQARGPGAAMGPSRRRIKGLDCLYT